jgi:MFS family permease
VRSAGEHANTIALLPFMPVVAYELETSVAALGQVTAMSMALATGLGLVAGQYADRFGYRRILLLGVATVVVSAFGSAVAPNSLFSFLPDSSGP